MKTSIKYKLPLIVLSVFLLFVSTLLVFYRGYVVSNVRYKLDMSSQRLEQLNEQVSKGVSDRFPDKEAIQDYINEVSKSRQLIITVYDTRKNVVFQSDTGLVRGLGFRTKDISVLNGKTLYIVEVEHAYLLKNILGMDIVRRVLSFAVVSLFIILIPLIIFLHFDIVKPLGLLCTRLAAVGYRPQNQSLGLKRKDEIGELARNFDEMVKKLDASYNEQTEMISSISHDLKTPLTSILGYMERLMAGKAVTEEKRMEYYQVIYKKAQDIGNLVEEFSEYAKNEADYGMMKKELVPVEEFFLEICREYTEELQTYNAEVEYNVKVPRKSFINADINKLRRVYANLISNALKYSEAPVKLYLSCEMVQDRVCFTVEDNGTGIPETEFESIFNKFYRVEKSRSLEKGGIGLGLAICRRIIENHDGSIEAYNAGTRGLGIRFCIPVEKSI